MLVLARKINESLIIDGCIKVTVLRIGQHQIRLGIEAPPDICVGRAKEPAWECPLPGGQQRTQATP